MKGKFTIWRRNLMKRENPSSAKIIFLAPVGLPASRHCYNSLKFQSLLNKHQEIQNWNKATQILTCPNVQIFSVCSTTFFSQVEQCRLFNSLISCRQDNYQQFSYHLSTTLYPAADKIFYTLYHTRMKSIHVFMLLATRYIIFGKTTNALLTNLLVVKSVILFKKTGNVK